MRELCCGASLFVLDMVIVASSPAIRCCSAFLSDASRSPSSRRHKRLDLLRTSIISSLLPLHGRRLALSSARVCLGCSKDVQQARRAQVSEVRFRQLLELEPSSMTGEYGHHIYVRRRIVFRATTPSAASRSAKSDRQKIRECRLSLADLRLQLLGIDVGVEVLLR